MLNICTCTNFKRPNVIALLAIQLAELAAGAKEPKIVKNFLKPIVVLSAIKEGVLDLNLGNVVTYSVLEDVLDLNNLTAWPVGIFMMMGFANRNVHPCKDTIQSNTSGKRIRMENMPMVPLVFETAQNIY